MTPNYFALLHEPGSLNMFGAVSSDRYFLVVSVDGDVYEHAGSFNDRATAESVLRALRAEQFAAIAGEAGKP